MSADTLLRVRLGKHLRRLREIDAAQVKRLEEIAKNAQSLHKLMIMRSNAINDIIDDIEQLLMTGDGEDRPITPQEKADIQNEICGEPAEMYAKINRRTVT